MMRLASLAAAAALVAAPAAAQPVNGGFENLGGDGRLVGWTIGQGLEAAADNVAPYAGTASLRIARPGPEGFGVVSQRLGATPYRGRVVRFRAAVRVSPGSDRAGLWLRADRETGGHSFLDNMQDRPIRDGDWTVHEIVAPIAEDTGTLVVGLMIGSGQAWIDEASVTDIGPLGDGWTGPRALSETELANLTAFARLYGYVRWFHPTPDGVDWTEVAMAGVDRIEVARDADDLAARLESFFAPLAPALRVTAGGMPPEPAPGVDGPLMRWRHVGVGTSSSRLYSSALVEAGAPETISGTLPGGVSFTLPIAAPVPALEPIATAMRSDRPEAFIASGNDRTTRLAATVVAWNLFQHFFPYHPEMETDWSEQLPRALSAAAVDESAEAFETTLQRMMIPLSDGHGRVGLSASSLTAPLQWDWIEDQLVITAADAATGLAAGDLVLSIDGDPAAERLNETYALITGSPQWRIHRALERLRAGERGEQMTLRVSAADGAERDVQVSFSEPNQPDTIREPRPNVLSELSPSIWYVDLTRIPADQLQAAWPNLAAAHAVIFDMRGYPDGVEPTILGHLTHAQIRTAAFNVLTTTLPDRDPEGVTVRNVGWPVQPAEPSVGGQVLFLIDGRAISYAETLMGMVQAFDLGETIGGPTAGANGNVNSLQLPGGYHMMWTGMRVALHDGGVLHGQGIEPDVPVSRTIEGVRAGRDEILEAALARIAP